MQPPRTLDEVRAIKDRSERLRACVAYIEAGEAKLADARLLRNHDVRALIAEVGPAKTRDISGLPLSTVKAIRGQK